MGKKGGQGSWNPCELYTGACTRDKYFNILHSHAQLIKTC